MTEQACQMEGIAAVNRRFARSSGRLLGRLGTWLSRLAGQIRRQYLSRLRPGYVARMRESRTGACRGCGSCCDLTFHCPYLDAESRCKDYERRTLTCRDFPIDALDLRLTRAPCGFHFTRQPEDANRADSPG